MKSSIAILLILLLVAVQVLFAACAPRGPVANGPVRNQNTGLTYFTIQGAIDAPQTLAGHTLLVPSGTFTENIIVDKSITIIGASAASSILQASRPTSDVVAIIASGVTIKRITIANATASGKAGIRLEGVTGVLIDSCTVINNFRGIQLVSSSNNTFTNCNITSNIENGIAFFAWSNGNRITNNTVANTVGGVGDWTGNGINIGDQSSSSTIISGNVLKNNAHSGIIAYAGSNFMQITGNTIYENAAGIMLGWSTRCIIENNTITNNSVGMIFDTAPNNIFWGNNVSSNTEAGILMAGLYQTGNLIENNTISLNGNHGINIASTTRNSIIRLNTIEGNSIGLRIGHNPGYENYDNRIYNNNFLENAAHAVDDSPEVDYWDNGYPEGGNHWGNWTAPDTDEDGFVDDPYPIPGGYSQDNFPYVRQNGWLP